MRQVHIDEYIFRCKLAATLKYARRSFVCLLTLAVYTVLGHITPPTSFQPSHWLK